MGNRVRSFSFFLGLLCRLFRYWKLAAATALLILGCFGGACPASAQSPQSDQPVSIRGTVVNSVTHDPIAHAQVYSQDNRFAAMTDEQGHFVFILPPREGQGKGEVLFNGSPLVARKPGFLADPQGENWSSSGQTELTITLIPEAILMGRITLANADPPDRIQVQLFRREINEGLAHWTPSNMAITNSRGEYRFAELYPGDYRVGTHEVAEQEPGGFAPVGKVYGYPPLYFPAASDFPSASTIHLSAGKIFEANVSLTKRQYYPVSITVVNAPAADTPINVNVSVQGDGAPGYALGYNGFDPVIRGFLPTGSYVVEARTFSQQSATGLLNLRVSNGPVQGARLMLLSNGTISVQVKEEFTSPVPTGPAGGTVGRLTRTRREHGYLNVSLEPISDFGQGTGAYLRPPAGPNDESLAIDNVQPGRYWVRVSSSRGYAASVTSDGLDMLREALVVGAGGSSSPIEITMRDDTASFEGTVEGANNGVDGTNPSPPEALSSTPFAYIYCVPLPDSSGQFTQVWVAPDGKFTSQEMSPGQYRALAFKHQQNDLEYRNPEAMKAYESKGLVVSLAPGQKEHLQIPITSKVDENAE